MFAAGEKFKEYQVLEILKETPLATTLLAKSGNEEKFVIKVFKGEPFTRDEGYAYLQAPRNAIRDGAISNKIHLSFYTKVAREELTPGNMIAYLVRGYVEGEDLDSWRIQPRTSGEIKGVLRKICLALDHLHQSRLVHGGLCPRNVILEGNVLKLTDFGSGRGFLSALLGVTGIDPEDEPFLPPWRNDLEKFQSPATDIYPLGVLLFLLERGTFPEGIPDDAPAPVQKALHGDYRNVNEFRTDVEKLMEEQSRAPEKQEQEGREPPTPEENEGEGAYREDEVPESTPEVVPDIDISGEGIEGDSSGLGYQLNLTLAKDSKGARTASFVLTNQQQDDREITLRISVDSDSEWIQVKPAEIKLSAKESQRFEITFGPFQSGGEKKGKIVLEKCFTGTSVWLATDIMVTAVVVFGSPPEEIESSSWMQWAAGFVILLALAAFLSYHLPWHGNRKTTEHSSSARSSSDSQSAPVPPASLPPSGNSADAGPPAPVTSQTLPVPSSHLVTDLSRISDSLLARGEFLSAQQDLTKLWAANPGNQEVGTLINKLTNALTVRTALISSPGQGEKRHEGLVVISSENGFKLEFTPSDNCYLYVYHIDSHENVTQLFPNSEASAEGNPLLGGRTYRIPDDYFILDRNTGLETIFFVASRLPATDLEDCYARLTATSAGQQRDIYYNDLVERINARRQAMDAGITGCLFQEQAFWHGES